MEALKVLTAVLGRGPRVVGAVLSGLLDDGAADLRAVRSYGGYCLVQTPDDAEFSPMRKAALRALPDARSLPRCQLSSRTW